jgi:NAD(P)-dependent dehydrogenase (short-subunit alcohol dehydrogenase family)
MTVADKFNISGYGAIVTGGASGIGLAYAETLAEAGARVSLFDLSRERVEAEVTRLKKQGYDVRGTVLDAADRKALDKAFRETADLYGRLDVVFANAGIDPGIGFIGPDGKRSVEGAIENYTDERWDRVIEVNLNAVFATIRAAARHMKPRNSGSIVVTTSISALRNGGRIGAACMATKAGAAHLMRNAALELAKYGIRVNAIAPGFFETNIGGGWLHDAKAREAIARGIPLGRVASTEEMKALALFLASPASGYVTGAQIPIDGGLRLGVAD